MITPEQVMELFPLLIKAQASNERIRLGGMRLTEKEWAVEYSKFIYGNNFQLTPDECIKIFTESERTLASKAKTQQERNELSLNDSNVLMFDIWFKLKQSKN